MTRRVEPGPRPSMTDVGRVAQVSAQTVSRYFTGRGYVGEQTRGRIEAAIEQLGYRPNHAARHLRSGRSHTLGVLAVGQILYGTAAILTGLASAARDLGYALMITQLDIDIDGPGSPEEIRRALDGFLSARVDGLIMMTPYLGSEKLLDDVWESLPIVTVSGRPRQRVASVSIDSRAAGEEATRHLIALGHRRILHLAGPESRNEGHERAGGYHDALTHASLAPLPLVHGDWSAASGHAAGRAADPATFTAVFAGNDQMALGFIAAMRERGLRCPADYSIVGVDDMPDAQYFDPPLSSMSMDFVSLGRTAIELLVDHIDSGVRPAGRTLPSTLVARASSAPLPARPA